jgi:hypothetical protein
MPACEGGGESQGLKDLWNIQREREREKEREGEREREYVRAGIWQIITASSENVAT